MPELPEVETTKNGIMPHLVDNTVVTVIIRAPKLRWPIPHTISKELPGMTVRSIERRAKYLLVHFDHGTLIMHLGMSGRLKVLHAPQPAQKHDHVDFNFADGACLRYTDPRRFGCILWTSKSPLEHPLLRDLGPEPFDPEFTTDYLLQKAAKKKIPAKTFIMDGRVVVGVGNIYASEALHAAKIDPRRSAQNLTSEQARELIKHIKRILKSAIAQGGTTLKDFYNSEGKPGYFKQKLKVYDRDQEPCLRCDGTISSLVIAQRNTYFCPSCQT